MSKKELNFFTKQAIETGEIEGLAYYLIPSPTGSLNGYALFPKRPTVERGYNGILSYVPVHGGITFAEDFGDEGMLYGFDTCHYNSNLFPIDDHEWLKDQIRLMILGIQQAAKVEKQYLIARRSETRAKYAQTVVDVGEGKNELGFGATINLLSGQL